VNDNKLSFVLAMLFLCGLLIQKLKEVTQKTIVFLNNFTENVMVPLENRYDLIEIDESQRIAVKWTKKKIGIFVGVMVIYIVFSVTMYFLQDKKEIQFVGFIILFYYFVLDFIRSKRKSSICVEQGISVEGYILESVKDEIVEMCNKLNISTIDFKMWNDNNVNAESSINKDGIPQIRVSNGFINAIYSDPDAKDILLVTVGHELGHIFYKDNINIQKRMRNANLIALIGYIIIMLLLYGTLHFSWLIILVLVIFCIELVFGKVMTDIRYWGQIAELKADRLAIQIYEGGKEVFVDFWKNKYKEKSLKNYNIVYQYYKRYIENEAHPSMHRRMKILESRKQWSLWEYFEHALLIRKWRLTNKGWNGK
jgi:Zn-dependent protease with chaperone function